MTISTNRLFQTNQQLFSKLNKDLKSLQEQAGSGLTDLKLSQNLTDISELNALNEMTGQLNQFISNATRSKNELTGLDLAFERLQNLTVQLQEISVSSTNSVLTDADRKSFVNEVKILKNEFLGIANQTDSLGNGLFSGISTQKNPFVSDATGKITYEGSSVQKTVVINPGISINQNFSGSQVFENLNNPENNASVFEIIDSLISSLEQPQESYEISTSISANSSEKIYLPDTGDKADISFFLNVNGVGKKIETTIYSNNYEALAAKINESFEREGLVATLTNFNEITLSGAASNISISSYSFAGNTDTSKTIRLGNQASQDTTRLLNPFETSFEKISNSITKMFEHFSTLRAEVSNSYKRAEQAEEANQDLLVDLQENVDEIRDADMAKILTDIELLMTKKEAAQATFTRISSKSLFDFLT